MSGTALVGREVELAELDERLRTHRVVTVVGPGGVGKTALADAAAARAASAFAEGARRIDLTRVESPGAVAGALASQMGYESWEALLWSPGDKPMLLVVDNCEHLLDAAASAIAALLDACHLPTVLATSRSPLELPGEAVVALAPLPVPPDAHPDPRSFPSVQLFLSRASQAGATVPDADVDVVAHLCRRLDGLPLAIELAAARARSLTVRDIAARLLRGVEVLERPRFRGDRRHRSIVDTVRWSYDLLEPSASCLLQQLSVFAGPFPVEAARAVAAAERCGPDDTFDHDLEELVFASLLHADTTGPGTRYRLLDTVRRFARDELTGCGGLDKTMDAFVDVVLAAALDATRDGTLVWRPEMIGHLLDAFDNLAEALRWCNDHDDDAGRALTLSALLWTVVHQGRADDIVVLARSTLERWDGVEHPRLAAALATLATAEYVTGRPEEALAVAEPAVERLPARGSAPVKLLRLIGQARSAVGDLPGGIEAFEQGAALAREQGMAAMAIELDIVGAHVAAVAGGDADDAVARLRAAEAAAERLGSPVTASWAATTLGWLLLRTDVPAAMEVVDRALSMSRRIEYPIGIAGSLRSLAYGHMLEGDLPAARQALRELLDDIVGRGALSDARLVVDASATLAHLAGHPEWDVLAATARSLPVVSLLLTPGSEPIPLPASTAEPLERRWILRGTRAVLDSLAALPLAPGAAATAPRTTDHRFAAVGDVYELGYDGVRATVRASKGMADLARLLAEPGREVHCLDLAGVAVEEASTGEVIDATARRRYEERIRDLQGDIDEAEAANDLARADRAQAELDALVDHLTAALGHAGRTRRGAGSAERARSTVTQRIRAALRRIEEAHPALGRHLQASVVTGTWCCYRPERPTRWDTGAA
ncbi:MAG: ATP-binding protein [Acidimicrobiia bacterium]